MFERNYYVRTCTFKSDQRMKYLYKNIVPLIFNIVIPASFSFVEASMELLLAMGQTVGLYFFLSLTF